MKKKLLILSAVLGLTTIYAISPSLSRETAPADLQVWQDGQRISLKSYFRDGPIPSFYRLAVNPLRATEPVVAKGAAIYQSNCKECHGVRGEGNGPNASGLAPPVTTIDALRQGDDAYLFWAVAEGSGYLASAMPVYKGDLNDEEIWQVVHYLKQL